MLVPNRTGSSTAYRYGFQGQEKDDELKGEGNSLNYTFRMHDPRVGRFFAVDPLEKDYPWYTPYQFSGNKVIQYVELEGLEESESGSNSSSGASDYAQTTDSNGTPTGNILEVSLRPIEVVGQIKPKTYGGTPEVTNQYYPSYSKDEYIDKFGAEKYYNYTSEDAVTFHKWTLDKTKESNDAELLFKLGFFIQGYTTLGDVVNPFQGFNVARTILSSSSVSKFNYKIRFTNSNPYSKFGFKKISSIDDLKEAKGLYIFDDAVENLPYVGKSNNSVLSRINNHIKNKKYFKGGEIYFKPLIGKATDFEVQETIIINELGGLRGTANKRLPVSTQRNEALQLGINNYGKYQN
jgi:RHS repeat-associated protein